MGGRGGGGREGGGEEEETAVPTVLISVPPHPWFFPSASGYLLIGYSKISETRRYRRKKRGETPRREDENRRKREMGREAGKAEKGGREERAQGGRVVADRTSKGGG